MVNIRKLNFLPRTLEDKIVKDSLEAINELKNKEPIYLVGGMSVQSYLSHKYHRPTSDMDFSYVGPLSYPDFRIMVKPV
ncbi:hypothetical protein K0A97_00145 [Patescibacteria group bacterium]|nr:hypothetical protein [Patescibacteria group bacterium]